MPQQLRLLACAFLFVQFLQEPDRKAFDALIDALGADNLEAREKAAAALVLLPAPAEAWLNEAAGKANADVRAHLQAVLARREERREKERTVALVGRTCSPALLKAFPALAQKLVSDNDADRIELLEALSGFALEPANPQPNCVSRTEPPPVLVLPRELAFIGRMALKNRPSLHVKMHVLALGNFQKHSSMREAFLLLAQDGDPRVRNDAIGQLGSENWDATFAAPWILEQLLADRKDVVRLLERVDWSAHLEAALTTLAKAPADRAGELEEALKKNLADRAEPAMRTLLASRDVRVRRLAAHFYAQADVDLPASFLTLVDDPDPIIRAAALGRAGEQLPRSRIEMAVGDADAGVQQTALQLLLDEKPRPVRQAVERARNRKDPRSRDPSAWDELATTNPPPLPFRAMRAVELSALLQAVAAAPVADRGADSRRALAAMLRETPFSADHKDLRTLLASTDVELVAAALGVLAKSGVDVSERLDTLTLKEALKLDPSVPMPRLAKALKRLRETDAAEGEQPSIDARLARLGDEDARARYVAWALSGNHIPYDVPWRLVEKPDREAIIAEIVPTLAVSVLPWESMNYSGMEGGANWAIAAGITEAIDPLLQQARSARGMPDTIRTDGLLLADPAALLPRMRPLLKSEQVSDRRLAAWILGEIGALEERTALERMMREDPSSAARASAAYAIAQLRIVDDEKDIAALLTNPDAQVRRTALWSLHTLRRGPTDLLRTVSKQDRRSTCRYAALRVRARIGDADCAKEYLEEVEPDILAYGFTEELRALAVAGAKPVLAMLRTVQAATPTLGVAEILAAAGDADALAWLKAEPGLEAAAARIELGLPQDLASALAGLVLSRRESADRLFIALNRMTDAKRYEALRAKPTPPRWAGRTAADLARTLSELLGVPVTADDSTRDLVTEPRLEENRAFGCHSGAVPVFDGDGIRLYSYDAARRVWDTRAQGK